MNEINVNKSLLNQLYNREAKEAFLRDYLEDNKTRETYIVYLFLASEWENKIGKNLYDFSREDVIDLMANSFASSHASLRAFYSICKQYGRWATDRNYNKTKINPFELVKFNEHILPILNVKDLEDKYISEEQLWEIVEGSYTTEDGEEVPFCENYQDAVPLVLPFYSVKGNRNAEIRNLKYSDILEDNKIMLTDDDGSTRIIELPEKVIKLLKAAYNEKEYMRRANKYSKRRNVTLKAIELEETNSILKPCVVSKKSEKVENINEENEIRVVSTTITARVKKVLNLSGYEKMSINNIYDSGKLHLLRKIEEIKGGKPSIDDYKAVQQKFNDSVEKYSNIKLLYELVILR